MKALVTIALAILVAATVCADDLRLVDQWTAREKPAYGQQTAGLSTVAPPTLTTAACEATAGARYARFSFGADTVMAVALRATDTGTELFVDANADGSFGPDERAERAADDRRPPGFGKPGDAVWLMQLTKPAPRLAAFRIHPFGMMLVCALRGYAEATVPVGEKTVDIAVVDANANMVADYGIDQVYADLDGNSAFDPRAERMALQDVVELGGQVLKLTAGGPLEQLSWRAMPSGQSSATFTIIALTSAPKSLSATLSRRPRGVYRLQSFSESLELPMGIYRVESLRLQAPAADGALWSYQFDRAGLGDPASSVDIDQPSATVELLGALTVAVECQETAAPGDTLSVSANVTSASGLRLGACGPADFSAMSGMEAPPVTACLICPDETVVTPECSFSYG